MAQLSGNTVVIIGGSSGIGLACAAAAAAEGAAVVITGRSPDRLAEASAALPPAVTAVALDGTDEGGTAAMFAELGAVDHVFVSAAGPSGRGGVDGDVNAERPAMDTRLWGSVYAAKYASPQMRPGGSITFCSGVAGLRPWPGRSSIAAASCAAVEALARSLAIELAPIRVNTIVPGIIETPRVTASLPDPGAYVAAAERRLPVGRIGKPEDIAHALIFLMTNGYVSGVSLLMDGGLQLT
jgi:NAD(P)-dependent dehydrogenase (short-subunit alcohol dehydrogenase family)